MASPTTVGADPMPDKVELDLELLLPGPRDERGGKLPFAVGLGRATRTVLRQNLGVALVVMVTLVVAAATGLAGVSSAVILHEGSTLAVALNSLRLLGHQGG